MSNCKRYKKEFCCCFLTSFTADTKIWYNFVFLAKDTATNRVWIMFEHVQIVWVIDSHTPIIQRSKRYCDAALMLGKTKSFYWCLEMHYSVRMLLQKARASRVALKWGRKNRISWYYDVCSSLSEKSFSKAKALRCIFDVGKKETIPW